MYVVPLYGFVLKYENIAKLQLLSGAMTVA